MHNANFQGASCSTLCLSCCAAPYATAGRPSSLLSSLLIRNLLPAFPGGPLATPWMWELTPPSWYPPLRSRWWPLQRRCERPLLFITRGRFDNNTRTSLITQACEYVPHHHIHLEEGAEGREGWCIVYEIFTNDDDELHICDLKLFVL